MKLRECLEFSKDMGFYIVGEAYSCVDLYSSKIFEPSEIKKEMNELIAEFEANDCKPFCNYYYFYTHPEKHLGAKYNRNIFMEGIEWKPYARENYSEKYCSKANEHAAHYHAQRNKEKAATQIAALTR